MDKPKPLSLRMNAESKEMLSRLAKQFSIPEASVVRMALKQLHDRTFPARPDYLVRHCKECGNALTPGAHTYCEYCSKLLGLIARPTKEEVVDRIIKGG
jgi:hypothetical protein